MAGTTDRQAEALLDALNKERDDVNFKLYLGLKHISPYIEEAVEQMHNDGIKEAVTVVLAPHYSSFSVGSYDQRAQEKADEYGIQVFDIRKPFLELGDYSDYICIDGMHPNAAGHKLIAKYLREELAALE